MERFLVTFICAIFYFKDEQMHAIFPNIKIAFSVQDDYSNDGVLFMTTK